MDLFSRSADSRHLVDLLIEAVEPRMLAYAIALLAAAAAPAVQAQQLAAPERELPSVSVVSAALLPGLGIDGRLLPYAVQTASDKTLKQSQSGTLTDYMTRQLAGVNANDIQGNSFQSDITFRGFRASPILGSPQGMSVYLDGVRVNEPFGDVVNWDMLPEAAIASVSLVPGSNPMFGLNTLGGALAFTTKSGRSHPGLEAETSVSSAGSKRLDLAYGTRHQGGLHSFVAATLLDDNGWREHSQSRLGNLFAKIGAQRGTTQWDISLLQGSSRLAGNGLLPSYRWSAGGPINGLYESNPRAAYTFPDVTENRLTQIAASLRHALDAETDIVAGAYWRNSRRDGVTGDVSEQYSNYAQDCAAGFDASGAAVDPASCGTDRASAAALHSASLNSASTRQDSIGLSLNLNKTLERHQFTLGTALDASRVRYAQQEQDAWFNGDRGVSADPQAAPEFVAGVHGTSRALGLYATDTWEVARATHITGAARFNHVEVGNTLSNTSGEQPHERFTYSKLNPALGITRDLRTGLSVFANVAQSNRVPTVIELGCADPAQPCRLPAGLQSDPYLKQVVSRTIEAGTRWQASPGTSLSVSAYQTVNRDDILFFTAGATQQGYFANFARTRRRGIDFTASRTMGSISTHLSYSYLRATYDADGTLFAGERNVNVHPGTPIAGLPRHTLKLGIDWNATHKLTIGSSMLAVSSMATQGNEDGMRTDTTSGTPVAADWRIRGHAIFNLHASYQKNRQWELFARVSNLFNRRYETYGVLAQDMFPNGSLVQPHVAPAEAAEARFVAPGSPRIVTIGLRFKM
ncbi:MAG TPA: TonB-dependent receptor [Noviherbaspirillum sp.]|uniref:TonB-dependent receptor n=1 Tax=Noviherbaspirillum sp. TaxID=1926288 RepID=UPI002B45F1AC|nr:TonB-dependent receptor [Noviherbaspirillum sp.]HJV85050.1 TonB-dependent receptor [Noviherbaspirillum sp.]